MGQKVSRAQGKGQKPWIFTHYQAVPALPGYSPQFR